jgi:hypothetical protein
MSQAQDSEALAVVLPQVPRTLADLLNPIPTDQGKINLLPMLSRTADLIAEFLHKTVDQVEIGELLSMQGPLDEAGGFRAFLVEKRYKGNSPDSWVNYFRRFIRRARSLGWTESQDPGSASVILRNAWQPVVEVFAGLPKRVRNTFPCMSKTFSYLLRRGVRPAATSDEILDAYAVERVRQGRNYTTSSRVRRDFARFVSKYDLLPLFPQVTTIPHRKRYGVPWPEFPAPMRSQFDKLFETRLARRSKKHRKLRQIRPITVRNLRDFLCQLLGYARNEREVKLNPLTVQELLSEELVTEFVDWGLDRGLSPSGCKSRLPVLSASIKEYDSEPFLAKNFSWLDRFIPTLEDTPRELIDLRKAEKWIEYDDLDSVPGKIEAEMRRQKLGPVGAALMKRNASIMRFFAIVPFRQINLRGCKLGPPSMGGNLFKGPLSPSLRRSKSPWVREALKANSQHLFWQLYYASGQMKGKRPYQVVVPQEIVGPLEEYIDRYRPVLIDTPDSGPLFPSNRGRQLGQHSFTELIGNITMRYTGTRLTPHLARDIVTDGYLEEHPDGLLTMSKLLGHANPGITDQAYGSSFNAAVAVRNVEAWRQERQKRLEHQGASSVSLEDLEHQLHEAMANVEQLRAAISAARARIGVGA